MEDDVIQLAGCVILDDYGRILLLHRSADEFTHWELPGGKVEDEESPAQAAVRELREELAVAVEIVRPLGQETFEQNDEIYMFHWFLARIRQGQLLLSEPELYDDFDYIDIEDLPSLALSANMLVLEEKLLTGEVEL